MSGPKVVRVVTREELEAVARQQLQLLVDALEELRRCARRHGALDEAFEAGLEQRRVRMVRLFDEAKWAALQGQVPLEIAFLVSERDRIRAQAVASVEAERSKRQRTEGAARTLLAAFEAAGREPPKRLREIADGVQSADEAALGEMQGVLTDAFRQLAPAPRAGTSAVQRELAARLGAGETGQRFAEWLEARPRAAPSDPSVRLNALLAEVEALEEPEVARPFLERAAAISREVQEGRRALLTDALMLDVGAYRRARQAREVAVASLREVRCSLAALGTPTTLALEARISVALEGGQIKDTEGLLQEARVTLEVERREMAAAARRRAVLGGLAALGYEVREAMVVAWPKEGRIIVRKPGATDYGVELGAPADAARVQMRLVGSDRPMTPRGAGRDRDMETMWCAEFQQLRKLVAVNGTEVAVERALEAGAQPVKTVSLESSLQSEDVAPTGASVRRPAR
ncbi:hypothetical protein [Hyalangium rubrum]|uniref:Uncharacterized protein n=1 Tax=Hyalangium rubrum TaxID=3103134 RepID=A0ABU5HCR4_9BACT|nr:hypothetical protein [Hyalangium sp. s54d21]MDY7229900.1 hypothetical protein [Hyalangium sp. s54d21]